MKTKRTNHLKLTVMAVVAAVALSAWWAEATVVGQQAAEKKAARDVPDRIEFNRDIRPILSGKCFACHGPDAPNKKIRLRLDSEEAAKADLGRGRRAIVPGNPEQSQLALRIASEDELMRMPPVDSGHKLTQVEIALFIEWIRQGALWQKHWSFIAPVRPELPPVNNKIWPKNAVDYFVLSRLEREGWQPSPEADRDTLLRRLSFDLTGLPPTLKELDDFLHDRSPKAYEKVVDRLLSSQRYGERMAFNWLDAARYADTNGYQIDGDRSMWRWRDWVIEAFNRNLPFDQFTIEQLAGDLLPAPTLDQRIATAFNRNHRINAEGGIVPEEYAVEYAIDRVDTTSTVWLGMTLGCARCHNHKYDPFTQKEYYQLFAYFNSIPEDGRGFDQGNSAPWIAAPDREQQRRLRELEIDIAQTEKQFQFVTGQIAARQRHWEKSLAAAPGQQWFPRDRLFIHLALGEGAAPVINKSDRPYHHPPEPKAETKTDKKDQTRAEGEAVGKAAETRRSDSPEEVGFKDGLPKFVPAPTGQGAAFDGKLFFDAGRHADFKYKSTSEDFRERFAISVWIYPESADGGAIVTKMIDKPEEMDHGLPRVDGWGLFFAGGKVHFNLVREWNSDGYRAETETQLPLRQWHHLLLVFDGFRQSDDRVQIYVNGQPQRLKVNQANLYLYWGVPEKPLRIGGGGGPELRFKGAMDELRIYTKLPEDDEIAVLACAEPLAKIATIARQKRTKGQALKMQNAFLERSAPEHARQLWIRLAKLKERKKQLEDSFSTVMAMQELAEPRPAYVLQRGAYDVPGERVERGVPASLSPMPEGFPNNRLGLAKWLASSANPLTARVAVNRFWQMLFGTGLIKTAEDFGSRGEATSHPEMLDWLAVEFMQADKATGRSSAGGRTNPQSRGWDVKALLKTIVMSATYRQSSKLTPQMQQRDPENRLLARGPRVRLPAEMIRDQALFISGLLVERLGGPSVKPYQPEGLYKDMAFASLTGYQSDKGDGLWRRSLYTFWKRTVLAPNMQVFDASSREFCTVRETRTNTPLQSLILMNDATYIEAARMLAQRMLVEGGATPQERLAWVFRVVTSRTANEKELTALLRNLEKQADYFRGNPREAVRLLAVGEKRNDDKLSAAELAAYTATASLILNLDEVITKQ